MLSTSRLKLRQADTRDAPFLLGLLNEPDWRRYIADHDIRTLQGAEAYVLERLQPLYARHGVGLWLVELSGSRQPIGLCGLVRRDGLEQFDLGFAFSQASRRQGYAGEAARAVIAHAFSEMKLDHLLAITSPDNEASIRLLTRLGFEPAGHFDSGRTLHSTLFRLNADSPPQP